MAITGHRKPSKWEPPKVILALFERIYRLLQTDILDDNGVLFFEYVRENKNFLQWLVFQREWVVEIQSTCEPLSPPLLPARFILKVAHPNPNGI